MATKLYNSKGSQIRTNTKPAFNKQAQGLFGNIFGYSQAGKFKYRFYTLSDSNQGLDTYSRELLVRWSREMEAQNPTISSAIDILSQFAVGDSYLPVYTGNNKEWGKQVVDWLLNDWYPNCCTRGNAYDFQTSVNLFSKALDTDGDFLQVFGSSTEGFPMFQIIPSHRIKNMGKDGQKITDDGQYKDCIMSDGIIYTPQGTAVGACVENASNMVNSMAEQTPKIIFDFTNSKLIFSTRFFDKNRGIPSIGSAILQAISLQELDQYEMDKLKMQSMIGLVEHTPSGEAPIELQNTFQQLLSQSDETGNALFISPNDHAVKIIQGPEMRYVKANGGDIKSFASTGPTNDAQEYMTKLETQVLSTLGVPHQLVFSTTKIGGRVTSACAEIFRAAISKRQRILDKTCKFTVGWAIAKAIKAGILPENNDENLTRVFDFTHPPTFSLDAKYDADIITNRLTNGISSMNDATTNLLNKTASEVMSEQEAEQIEFYNRAKKVSETTGIDLNMVIANWRQTPLKTTQTMQVAPTEDTPNE